MRGYDGASVMTDPVNIAALQAQVSNMAGDLADMKADQRRASDDIRALLITLAERNEREKVWATKQELTEVAATLRETLQPIAAQAAQAHRRLDEVVAGAAVNAKVSSEALKRVEDEVRADIAVVAAQVSTLAEQVDKQALSWAKVAGAATAAGMVGAVIAALSDARSLFG